MKFGVMKKKRNLVVKNHRQINKFEIFDDMKKNDRELSSVHDFIFIGVRFMFLDMNVTNEKYFRHETIS